MVSKKKGGGGGGINTWIRVRLIWINWEGGKCYFIKKIDNFCFYTGNRSHAGRALGSDRFRRSCRHRVFWGAGGHWGRTPSWRLSQRNFDESKLLFVRYLLDSLRFLWLRRLITEKAVKNWGFSPFSRNREWNNELVCLNSGMRHWQKAKSHTFLVH